MSRRYDDRYEERSTLSRRPRDRDRDYEEVDFRESRYDGPAPQRRGGETIVKERENDTVVSQGRRTERPGRQPDFLREDYGRTNAGPLVVREERFEEDDYVSRAPPRRRRSMESTRSRPPPPRQERVEKEEVIIRERDRDNAGPPYPRSERRSFGERDQFVFRERERSRPPPSRRGEDFKEDIDIRIREDERPSRPPPRREEFKEDIDIRIREDERPSRPPPRRDDFKEEIDIRIREDERSNRPPPPRSEVRERDVEEFRIRRGGDVRPPPMREVEKEEITISREERARPPPPREVEKEEITIKDTVRRSPSRDPPRGRGREEEIDINIRDRSAPPPRQRSQSRGVLVKKDHEEWVVRRRRTPSPSPSPVREVEKEQIVIRRRERTPSPEPEPPPREIETEQIIIRRRERTPSPEPEPPPPPPPDPIYRPPIIQEVITHHRHIDHGMERARSPTPPPPPPSPPKEDDLEISIRRQGTRNGKPFEEEIKIDRDVTERDRGTSERVSDRTSVGESNRQVDFLNAARPSRDISRHRSVGPPARRRYEEDVSSEADYYNRRVTSRGYPGEAYNGVTKDWGLVDIPPGTERVEMDGVGGGRQEITWNRYDGDRRGHFYTGDRVYEEPWGNGRVEPPAPPPAPLPPPPSSGREEVTDIRITERRGGAPEPPRRRERDPLWTEITKDLVTREAIDEAGYQYEETDSFFYVQKYLEYEEVHRLVQITEDIRRQRRERIRELQYNDRRYDRGPGPPPMPAIPPPPIASDGRRYEENFSERDYYRDRRFR